MRINKIKRKPSIGKIDRFRKESSNTEANSNEQIEDCNSEDIKDRLKRAEAFASEFLFHSIGSLEWEQLRTMAKDILRRSGDNTK